MKRRDVLKALPIGAALAASPFAFGGFAGRAFGRSPLLSSLLNAQSNDGKSLIIINLQGGNDGLNTVIPYQDPLYYSSRKRVGWANSGKSTLNAFALGASGMALNPNLDAMGGVSANAQFMKIWNEGKLAIIQSVGYDNPNLSHFRATDIWNQATDSAIVLSTGWIGRFLGQIDPAYPTDVKPGDDPLGMQIYPSLSPIFQGSSIEMGLAVSDPSRYDAASQYADDTPTTTNGGAELQFIIETLVQSDTYGSRFKTLFPLKNGIPQTPKDTIAYPTNNPLAVQLQKVGWCIASGMTTRVYFVNIGSFDTHVNQTSNGTKSASGQGLLLNQLAEAISIFQANMEALGVDDKYVGMTYSEFGRRVNDNASNGTDHGTAAPMFLFGTGVQGGLYGANPGLDSTNQTQIDPNGNLIKQFDFRQVYASVLGDWFGIDQSMRKAILMDTTNGERFGFQFPLNGSTKTQSLFKNPQAVGTEPAPTNFVLQQNTPNPFNRMTTINFALAESASVVLEVFDSRGALLATPIRSHLSSGDHHAVFDASKFPSGTYFYRLQVGRNVQTKRMTLLK